MSRARGFSLVEVLLATALLAVGIALAFGALANATRATERAEAVAQRNERLRAVQAFVRRQVGGALAQPFEFNETTGDAKVFELERDQIRLVAPMPGYLSRGGPHLQTFRLVRGPDGLRLEFQHQQLTPDGPLPNPRPPEVLLDGIAEARFEARDFDQQGKPGPWTARWDLPAQMPRLVRLQVRMRDPRARFPLLVVAPRLGQSPLPAGAVPASGQVP
jgi:general secretion pathway protein J